MKVLVAFCLGLSTALSAQQKSTRLSMPPLEAHARARPGEFENHYLKIQILFGWTVATSGDQTLNLSQGKYLLSINPIFTHASGIIGGRFSEIVSGMPSIDAVTGNVDQPASGTECSQSDEMSVTKAISLGNLYTDSSKTGNGCVFPSSGSPVWFGSYFSGGGPESEYTITLAYSTTNVNCLPKRGSPELTRVFAEVKAMLKSLHLKPPIVVSKVSPQSALPGATVTIYGSGFHLINQTEAVTFRDLPDIPMPAPIIAQDGNSLTFQVPTSVVTTSCQEGRIDVGGYCVPIPPNHVDVNDCPRKSNGAANLCGIPISPGTYQISVTAEGWGVSSAPLRFTVTAPKPSPVAISLVYPTAFVSEGDTITVRGRGFSASGNSVRIGSAIINNLFSPDGKTITFPAPDPAGSTFIHGLKIFKAFVSNANGESNSISFEYR